MEPWGKPWVKGWLELKTLNSYPAVIEERSDTADECRRNASV